MIHDLKCWPGPFEAIRSGAKTHEIRKADRPYAVGDVLRLLEWEPARGEVTGRLLAVDVTYLTSGGEWGLPADVCVMSVARRGDHSAECQRVGTHDSYHGGWYTSWDCNVACPVGGEEKRRELERQARRRAVSP